nr:hypothetical protein [Ciceribacter thiooxidans]
MHLLLAQKGSISDGEEAIDLGQSAGDIIFLTAADTELSAIAAAVRARGEAGPKWRLASLMALKHPMSVDTYVERTARHARLIVVRALGGASYFQYALEALHAAAQRSGAMIAVLPGDDKPDEGLSSFSNLPAGDLASLWAYLIEGGDANAGGVVAYAEALVAGTERPEPARPLLKAGIWWPGRGVIGVEEWKEASKIAPHPPAGTFSPSDGEKGQGVTSASPSPACGEKVPEGRMRGRAPTSIRCPSSPSASTERSSRAARRSRWRP